MTTSAQPERAVMATDWPGPKGLGADRSGDVRPKSVSTRLGFLRSPAAQPAMLGAAALLGCVAVAAWNPGDTGGLLSCPTKAVLGLDCPFCGGTRAVAQLTRGHLGRAADHNLIVVALAPIAVAVWTIWMWSSLTGRPMPKIKTRAWHGTVIAAVLVAFTVIRNVKPGAFGTWLASESSS